MNRLSEELPDGFARDLLESAQHDAPSTGATQRALAAATAAVPLKTAAAALALSKVGFTLLAAAAVIGGTAALHSALSSKAEVTKAPEPINVAPPREVERSEEAAAELEATPTAPALARATKVHAGSPSGEAHGHPAAHAHASTATTDQPAVPRAVQDDDLRAQVELIDRARALLAQDDVAALELLDSYVRQWPQGPFVIDAAILAIEAERKSGALEQARARAQRVLADHPSAAYRARVRRALDDGSIP